MIRRWLLMLPTLLGITFLVFLLCQFVPGGAIDQMKMRIAGAAEVGEIGAGSPHRASSTDIPEEDVGIHKALKHKSGSDNATSVLVFLGYSIPGYALGAVLLALFAVQRDWFPLAGFESHGFADMSFLSKVGQKDTYAVTPPCAAAQRCTDSSTRSSSCRAGSASCRACRTPSESRWLPTCRPRRRSITSYVDGKLVNRLTVMSPSMVLSDS